MSIFHMLKPINITFTFYNILDFVYHCFHFYNETSSRSSSWKMAILDLIQKFTPLQSPWSFSSKATPPPPPPSLSLLSLSPYLFLPLHLHLSPPICPVLSFPISSFPFSCVKSSQLSFLYLPEFSQTRNIWINQKNKWKEATMRRILKDGFKWFLSSEKKKLSKKIYKGDRQHFIWP